MRATLGRLPVLTLLYLMSGFLGASCVSWDDGGVLGTQLSEKAEAELMAKIGVARIENSDCFEFSCDLKRQCAIARMARIFALKQVCRTEECASIVPDSEEMMNGCEESFDLVTITEIDGTKWTTCSSRNLQKAVLYHVSKRDLEGLVDVVTDEYLWQHYLDYTDPVDENGEKRNEAQQREHFRQMRDALHDEMIRSHTNLIRQKHIASALDLAGIKTIPGSELCKLETHQVASWTYSTQEAP